MADVLASSVLPPNPGSRYYSMDEVFQVWFDRKPDIMALNVNQNPEQFRAETPTPIFHLDIHSGKPIENLASVPNGLTDLDSSESLPKPEQPETVLLQPSQIEWVYLDPAGNEQGPFNGDLMQNWLENGYLTPDLKLKQKSEANFTTLREFCERVQNFVEPFKVPLPAAQPLYQSQFPIVNSILNQQQGLQQTLLNGDRFSSGFNQFNGSGFGSQLFNPQLNSPLNSQLNTPLNTQLNVSINPQLNNSAPLNGLDQFNLNFSSPLGVPSLLQQTSQPTLNRTGSAWGLDTASSSLNQPAPVSPWVANAAAASVSRVNSPLVQNDVVDPDLGLHNAVADLNLHSSVAGLLDEKDQPVETIVLSETVEVVEEPEREVKYQVDASEQAIQAAQAAQAQADQAPQKETIKPKKQIVIETLKPAVQPQQAPAPWAATDSKAKPVVTLKQIQQLEQERLQKQRIEDAALAAAIAESEADATKVEEKKTAVLTEKPSLPQTSSWASVPKSSQTVRKTLAEIQREEAEAAAKSKAKLSNGVARPSFASALAAATPVSDNAWTTVAAKKAPVKKVAPSPALTGASVKATPQMLRSVSASSTIKSPTSTSAREDFLIWARSGMTNLYPTVSKDELLEIFTTLPSTQDSVQLVAETIYSSSATMDGRRFAQEFLKRKQKVEQQFGRSDDGDWTSAIVSSANKVAVVDEDGWNTTKKKGKKH